MEAHPRRILLVDDDEDDYILTRAMLSEARGDRFLLDWAGTYAKGLQAIRASLPGSPYDAILVDYDLGASTGLDMIAEAAALGCQAPIILLTGHGSYEVDLAAMKAGAADYLSKSEVSAPLLERSLRYAIEARRIEDALRQAQDELERRVQERTHELSQANILLEKVFSGIHLMIAHLDRELRFVRVNQNYAEANGLSPEDYTGKYHFDMFPNAENEAIFRNVIATGESYFTFRRPFMNPAHPERGVTYWDWSLQPIKESDGQVSGAVLSLIDVTETALAERALSESEARLQSVITAAPIILWAVDAQGVLTLLEGKGLTVFGLGPGELVGRPASELFNRQTAILEDLRRALAGEEILSIQAVAGSDEILETHYAPLTGEGGDVAGMIAVSTIVTERERAIRELRASNEMFESLFQASPDSTLLLDSQGMILRLNRQTEEKFGYCAEELAGQPVEMLMPLGARQAHPARLAAYFASPERRPMGIGMDLRGRKKDGSEFPVDVTVSPLQRGDRQEIVVVIHDITQRKQIEADLAEVQRRLFEGVEAGRVQLAQELHDGPVQDLYAVTYHLTGLHDALPDEASRQRLQAGQASIQQVIQVLRTICRDLRPPTLAPFGLEKAIRSHADGFRKEHPDIDLRLHLMSDGQSLPERQRLALFRIYQQALVNVVRHSAATQVDVRFIHTPEETVLEIQDNGVGFQAPERWITLAREGHLGLVGASERAEAIGGKLEVITSPGEGALIRVTC